MIVHVDLRLTHIELAKPSSQRLTVDMNHHAHPPRIVTAALRMAEAFSALVGAAIMAAGVGRVSSRWVSHAITQ